MKLVSLVMILFLFSSSTWAADTYQLDKDHTYVTWEVSHFGFSNVSGKFMADGTLMIDKSKPANSSVSVVIHTDQPVTGVSKLDDILKGKNYFASADYPTATFKSTKVVMSGKDAAKVYGTLTIRDVSKDVVLDVKLTQQGMHPYFHKDALGFAGSAVIKRSDFNIKGYLPGIGDDTHLVIETEAIAAAPDNSTPQ